MGVTAFPAKLDQYESNRFEPNTISFNLVSQCLLSHTLPLFGEAMCHVLEVEWLAPKLLKLLYYRCVLTLSQAEAPLMKNHLSIELSIFSGGRSWLAGSGGSWSGLTRLGEWETVRLVLWTGSAVAPITIPQPTYVEIFPGWTLPVMSLSQASAHSRITSIAYLQQCQNGILWCEPDRLTSYSCIRR